MATTEFGDISQRTAAYAAKEMLRHATPVMVLQLFGMTKPMPKNKAQSVKFRRPIPFDPATVALTEGVTPTAHKITYEDVTATLAQYGDTVTVTDVIQDIAEDPVLKNISALSGEQASETVEALTFGVLKGGTSVFYANGVARSAVNTPLTFTKLRAATRLLNSSKARKITSILSSSPNYGTQSVPAAFVAVAHTDCASDILDMPGFVRAADYGSRQLLCPQEIGSKDDIRFVLSPDLSPWADAGGLAGGMVSSAGSSADVYPVLIFGRDSYGTVPLKGKNAITPMVLLPNTPRGGDPLGQQGHVSWKTYFAALILNQAWMTRVEVAVTDL